MIYYPLASYPRIETLGNPGTRVVWQGEVLVQEKVDGSQVRLGVDMGGKLRFGSSGQEIDRDAPGMFAPLVERLLAMEGEILEVAQPDTWLFGEYLRQPQQNTLAYDRVPTGNLMLFDGRLEGRWMGRFLLERWARVLRCDLVPELYRGVATPEQLDGWLQTESYLGGERVEGVVIKNYAQTVQIGLTWYPLFVKHVNPRFKERNAITWASGKSKVEALLETLATAARWQKAIQHLRERDALTDSVRDIGPLILEISRDVEEEEHATLSEQLWGIYRKDALRAATRGFPEWYKAQLLERELANG